jgi:hypothetical protein
MRAAVIPTLLALILGIIACAPAPEVVGQKIYNDNCTSCHGKTARGNGPLASQLERPVPDLTTILERNGGTFPMADVMSTIDGYLRRVRGGDLLMPEFGTDLQAGPLVNFDSGDGILTPTPSRLIAIAEYLRSIQR